MSVPHEADCLERLRGSVPPEPYTARKITALTANPGCDRRALLDAAGIDKGRLVTRLGFRVHDRQSPFAIIREQAFEEQIRWGGFAELITLLRAELDVPVPEANVADFNSTSDAPDARSRAIRTTHQLRRLADGSDELLILDHPVLTVGVAGRAAYLEPFAVTHRIGGQFYLVQVKAFPSIDGQADAGKVAQATMQAAVHVLALRRMLREVGGDPASVADKYLLICPKDFSNRPYGKLIDLRQQLDAVEFQFTRLKRVDRIAEALDDALGGTATLDLSVDAAGLPVRREDEIRATVDGLIPFFSPDCLDHCEVAPHCRREATEAGEPARFGIGVRDAFAGISSTVTALQLIGGEQHPDPAQSEVVQQLRRAEALRLRRSRGALPGAGGAA